MWRKQPAKPRGHTHTHGTQRPRLQKVDARLGGKCCVVSKLRGIFGYHLASSSSQFVGFFARADWHAAPARGGVDSPQRRAVFSHVRTSVAQVLAEWWRWRCRRMGQVGAARERRIAGPLSCCWPAPRVPQGRAGRPGRPGRPSIQCASS